MLEKYPKSFIINYKELNPKRNKTKNNTTEDIGKHLALVPASLSCILKESKWRINDKCGNREEPNFPKRFWGSNIDYWAFCLNYVRGTHNTIMS